MAGLLKLSPPQQSALQDFIVTSSKSAKLPGATEDQLRSMSLLEKSDYWSDHLAKILSSARADATALHHFYGSLSAEQRALFDQATKQRQQHATIAADVVSSPIPDVPDYKLPARTEPSWLIKPSADNMSRVYPFAAARDRVSGKVSLSCMVDEDGYLADCLVRSEVPKDMGFGNAALEVTAYMRMLPATNYGVPVRSAVNVPVTFRLDDTD